LPIMLDLLNIVGMRLAELGFRIRQARQARGITQARLAKEVGISRPTLNQLESGLLRELGTTKVLRLLDAVGLEVILANAPARRPRDHLSIASTAASVGFAAPLNEDELLRSLLTGRPPPGKRPHLRRLFEDAPAELIRALLAQVALWSKPGRIEKNVAELTRNLAITADKRWTPAG
jgi:transcriptional regulator with XRE-family HTH domain